MFARLHARPSHTLPVKRVLRFDMAQPERRYDVTPVTRAGAYLVATRVASGGRGGQKSWIRRRGWHAGHEHGWFAVAVAALTSCAGGGNIEGSAAPSRSASQLPTPTVSLPTPTRSAQRPEVPSPTPTKPSPARLIEPANRGADSLSRTDVDAIGDEESLAVTDPRGDHHRDPDSHFRSEYVDCHPVGDY